MSEDGAVPETIRVQIPSRLELLGILDCLTLTMCKRLGFNDDMCSQVTMSVIEAGTNAIQHGHQRDAAKPVDVTFQAWPDRLEIAVHDSGAGFDTALADVDITSPEHLLDARGRGIYIMRCCMDSVDFEFSASGTVCRLLKRRPARSG
jgi:serine/threonine-protein kinase RsbW